jgi:hypothetical protein
LTAIAAGVATLAFVRLTLSGSYPWLDPTLSGVVAAGVAFAVVTSARRNG